jgi:hypothetical protein
LGELSFSDEPETQIEKALDEWGYKEFIQYWEYSYKTLVNSCVPRRGANESIKLKAAITSSLKKYGPKVLRDMVDYAFLHYSEFPAWNIASPTLIFAAHYWSSLIYSRVTSNGSSTVVLNNKLEEMLR